MNDIASPYINGNPRIISRTEAKSRGLKHYFTGRPCLRGHVLVRNVHDGRCTECHREDIRRYQTEHPEEVKARYRHRCAEDEQAGYYVYCLRYCEGHPLANEIFWIGSSCRRTRLNTHSSEARRGERNALKNALIRYMLFALGQKPVLEKLHTGLTKEQALDIEACLVEKVGTQINGTGPLACIRPGSRNRAKTANQYFFLEALS